MAIPEQQFMFKHVDARRSPGENARKTRAGVARERAAGWRVTSENADKVYFERSERDVRLARKPKPVRRPKPRPPRKGY